MAVLENSFMPFAYSERVSLYYESYGDSRAYAVILIHPIGGNILIWREEIELLTKRGYRVIAYELRGHYRTGIGRIRAFAIQELVDDLRFLIQHLKIDSCVLVGHSIGGIIASLYAARFASDGKIDGIVLINSSPKKIPDRDLDKHFVTREIAITKGIAALADYTLDQDKQSRGIARGKKESTFFRDVFTKTTVEGFVAATLSLYTIPDNATELLRTSRCKVLAVVGSDDDVFLRLLKATKEDLPAMELCVIDGSDHWLVIEKPRTLLEALVGFLDRVADCKRQSDVDRD